MSKQLCARARLRQAVLIGLFSLTSMIWAPPAASQNVTLINFTATSLPGLPEIYVEWETATEFDTVGFFVRRSDFAQEPYVRVSDFIVHEGGGITGAQYVWMDETPELGHTYFYQLEEITANQTSIFYGPVAATAGSPTPPVFHYTYLPLVARSG